MYKMYLLHHRQPFFCGCGCSITLELLKNTRNISSVLSDKKPPQSLRESVQRGLSTPYRTVWVTLDLVILLNTIKSRRFIFMRPEVTNYMPSVDTGARRRHVTLRSGPEELKGWMESGSIYRVAFFFVILFSQWLKDPVPTDSCCPGWKHS